MRWASGWVISSNTLGLSTSLYDSDAGSRSTGKERDTESGNDYFGARYYASSMGRFMSPDWSAKIMPVPYATMDDPQSLNLYAYMRNNPLGGTDPDGHCDLQCTINIALGVANGISRDGGVGPYLKNVGVGTLKGLGQAAYTTGALLNAGLNGGNPGSLVSALMNQPAALSPSNATQAQAAIVTSTLTMTVVGSAPAAIETESVALAAEIPEISLNDAQAANLARFEGNMPAGANPTEMHAMPNGGVAFQSEVPGKVPGSSAVYEKQVDAAGKTMNMTKTTYTPDRDIAHVKVKYQEPQQ
jgi:RHS repeat-associated protein